MAKIMKTEDNSPKIVSYTEEDMSETEEYFQNADRTNNHNKKPSTCSFTQDNRSDIVNGVTICALSSEKSESEAEFDNILLEAIDETLLSLGEPVKNTVYFHLKQNFEIDKSEIPQKIKDFSDIIHKIFGAGAGRLEIKFMKTLNSKVKGDIPWPEHDSELSKWIITEVTFVEYVYNMRKNYSAQVKMSVIPQEENAVINLVTRKNR